MRIKVLRYVTEALVGLAVAFVLTISIVASYEKVTFVYQGF